MKDWQKAIIFVVCISALSAGYFSWPRAASKSYRNQGSCLQACSEIISLVTNYARTNGAYPRDGETLKMLIIEDNSSLQLLDLVEYAWLNAANRDIPARTILIRCKNQTKLEDGRSARYVALASGLVTVVPEAEAVLGKELITER